MRTTAVRVSEQEVRAIQSPEFTDTWHPVSHSRVIDVLDHAVQQSGMRVLTRDYSVGFEGATMFGTWGLDEVQSGSQWMIGFRNSLNKLFALGVCAGNRVLVCSNMVFKGDDYIEFRKHTSGLDDDELYRLARDSMKGLIIKMAQLQSWQDMLRATPISEIEFKTLTFDAITRGIITPSEFNKFLDCHKEEIQDARLDGTLYTFHGAVTRLLRDKNLFQVSERTAKLVGMLTQYQADRPVGIVPAEVITVS